MICDIKSDDEKENYTSYKKKKNASLKRFLVLMHFWPLKKD